MKKEPISNKEETMSDGKYSDAQIIQNMDIPFSPVSDRLLVKPLPEVMLDVTHDIIDEDAMDEEKEVDDNGLPTLKTKTVTEKLPSNLRIGVVLAITETKWTLKTNTMIPEYKIGDKVVYNNKSAIPFDLFKDSVLLRKHDVLGVWLKDIEESEE
jgi:co-chaperonin GroES (HSP10)